MSELFLSNYLCLRVRRGPNKTIFFMNCALSDISSPPRPAPCASRQGFPKVFILAIMPLWSKQYFNDNSFFRNQSMWKYILSLACNILHNIRDFKTCSGSKLSCTWSQIISLQKIILLFCCTSVTSKFANTVLKKENMKLSSNFFHL